MHTILLIFVHVSKNSRPHATFSVYKLGIYTTTMRRAFELGSDVHIRFMKGSLARVEAGAQTEDNYSHTKVAENARAARKKASPKVIQKGGVIYTEQARKRIKFREEVLRREFNCFNYHDKLAKPVTKKA